MSHDHDEKGHGNKMCAMTCCPCHLDLAKISSIAKDATHICKACGHVANEAAHLCEPVPIP